MIKLDSVIHQAELPKRPEGMKNDRIVLGRLGLMVQLDNI